METTLDYFINDVINEIHNTKSKNNLFLDHHYNVEKALKIISKRYRLKSIDGYGSIRGSYLDIEEFIIPNTYGEEDSWNNEDYQKDFFNFVMLFSTKVILVKINGNINCPTINTYNIDSVINLNDFGGKRAYCLYDDDEIYFRCNGELLKLNKRGVLL